MARTAVKETPPVVARSLAALMPLGPVAARRMFGGWGLFLDGTMIALISGGDLYLKADAASEPRFAAAGSEPFVYAGRHGPVRVAYWRAPAGTLDGAEAMAPWAALALAAARRAAAGRAPRRPKSKTAPRGRGAVG